VESDQRIARQVGAAIRRLRLKQGQAQRQLADSAGIPASAPLAHERGQQLLDLRTLRLVLAALDVTSDEFGRHLGPWGLAGLDVKIAVSIARP
jgi:transcriptional regulator with XRE-family HTH domain